MKFSVGDKIIIKKTMEEGVMVSVVSDKVVNIDINGIVFPAFVDELDHPYLHWFLAAQKQEKSKQHVLAENIKPEINKYKERVLPEGMYLVLLPVYTSDGWEDTIEKCKIYLYNETFEPYDFEYKVIVKQRELFSLKNTTRPETEFYIHSLLFEEISTSPTFEFIFINKQKQKHKYTINLKTKKLIEKIEQHKNENTAFMYELIFSTFETSLVNLTNEKIVLKRFHQLSDLKHKPLKKVPLNGNLLIDLHAEKILTHFNQMSPQEILYEQLQYFRKKIDEAIVQHVQTMTVIHGIGNGTLKKEIYKIALSHPYVSNINADYNVMHGAGSSSIIFKYL